MPWNTPRDFLHTASVKSMPATRHLNLNGSPDKTYLKKFRTPTPYHAWPITPKPRYLCLPPAESLIYPTFWTNQLPDRTSISAPTAIPDGRSHKDIICLIYPTPRHPTPKPCLRPTETSPRLCSSPNCADQTNAWPY